jgi:hypothetical protein
VEEEGKEGYLVKKDEGRGIKRLGYRVEERRWK